MQHQITLRYGQYDKGEKPLAIIRGCTCEDPDQVEDVTGCDVRLVVYMHWLHQDEVRDRAEATTAR